MPSKRGRGAIDEEEESGGGGANASAAVRPLDTTPAGGGGPKAALWALGAHASARRQHALNTWAVMRAAAGRGDAGLAAAAAAIALRAPVPGCEGEAAACGVPPGWAAAFPLPANPAARTAAGRAVALGVGLDALRARAAAGGGGGGGGGRGAAAATSRLDLTRAARARVAVAPPVTPAADAAALGLALELAARGDTPQATAVLEAAAAAAAVATAAPTPSFPALSQRPARPADPATLSTLASLRYATWEAGRRGDGVAAGAALASLRAAVGSGGCGAEAATLAASLLLWTGGGGADALAAAASAAAVAVTAAPRDADAAALRLALLVPQGTADEERAGAALHLLRCSPASGRALGALLSATAGRAAKAACAPLRAEAGALYLEAVGGRGAAGPAPRSRAARAAWAALATGAGDLLAGLSAGGRSPPSSPCSSASDGGGEDGRIPTNWRAPPPPDACGRALAALRARARAWGGAGRPFDPSTLPSSSSSTPHRRPRRPVGAYTLADRGVAAAIIGGPGGAAFVEGVLRVLDGRRATGEVGGEGDDAAPAAASVRRALAAAAALGADLPPPWCVRVPSDAVAAGPPPLPQRTHPETGRLRALPPAWWAGSFPPSLLLRRHQGWEGG